MKTKIPKQTEKDILKENPEFFWKYNENKESKELAQTLVRYIDVNTIHKRHNNQIKKAIQLAYQKGHEVKKEEIYRNLDLDLMNTATNNFNAGYKKALKDVKKIINKFKGEDFTDFEIWVDMKKELKNKIKEIGK